TFLRRSGWDSSSCSTRSIAVWGCRRCLQTLSGESAAGSILCCSPVGCAAGFGSSGITGRQRSGTTSSRCSSSGRSSRFPRRAALRAAARAEGKLHPAPEATEGLRLLYSADPAAAMEMFRRIEERQPDYPVGYLLEANAQWWKIYCAACEIKYNTIDAWHRSRQ